MFIQATNIINMPIASIEERQKIGFIKKILVNKNNAQIIGFLTTNKKLFDKDKFLSEVDILDIDNQGVTTRTKSNLVDPQEIIRANNIIRKKFDLIGLKAITKTKKPLGRVSDYLVESNSLQVVKFYIDSIFKNKIIDYHMVWKITNQEIIFKDDCIKSLATAKIESQLATN
jgi:uncharacterized protein YrrD